MDVIELPSSVSSMTPRSNTVSGRPQTTTEPLLCQSGYICTCVALQSSARLNFEPNRVSSITGFTGLALANCRMSFRYPPLRDSQFGVPSQSCGCFHGTWPSFHVSCDNLYLQSMLTSNSSSQKTPHTELPIASLTCKGPWTRAADICICT